jgi:aryl-alcohol dehydrogenase-like predicted oxidoreductase
MPSDRSDFSRRALLQSGLLAGLGAALPRVSLSADNAALITKAIPATGQQIPVMGVGTNQFGRVEYTAVRDVLKRMHELGGTVIDTAAGYGESEVQIGKALEELGLTQRMFIVTKFNALGQPGTPAAVGGVESIERSFQRLKKIDLLFIHSVSSIEPMMPTLLDMKKQGRVRYIGVTSTRADSYGQIAAAMKNYPLDFVQIKYSIGDRAVEAEVLPLAVQRKVAVQVAQPFDGARNSLITVAAGRPLPAWAADYGIRSWPQYFLKYVNSHPAVTSNIPGSTKLAHIEDNQAAGRGMLPDAAGRRKMEEYWSTIVPA